MSEPTREDLEARMRKLGGEIRELPVAQKLRLAADLLDRRQFRTARLVLDMARAELPHQVPT